MMLRTARSLRIFSSVFALCNIGHRAYELARCRMNHESHGARVEVLEGPVRLQQPILL